MKIAKLTDFDLVPSVLVAIILLDDGLLITRLHLHPLILIVAVPTALAGISLALAVIRHRKFNPLLWLNVAWLILGTLVMVYLVAFQLTYTF